MLALANLVVWTKLDFEAKNCKIFVKTSFLQQKMAKKSTSVHISEKCQ